MTKITRIEKKLQRRLCKLEQLVQLMLETCCNSAGGIPVLPERPTDFNNPETPIVWIYNGSMEFWNGVEIKILDTNDGIVTDAFGNQIISDI